MSKQAIIMQLRPRWLQLNKDKTYSEEQVVDILCAFWMQLRPGDNPEEARETIITSFKEGQNED